LTRVEQVTVKLTFYLLLLPSQKFQIFERVITRNKFCRGLSKASKAKARSHEIRQNCRKALFYTMKFGFNSAKYG
jgi:hypothetical protein